MVILDKYPWWNKTQCELADKIEEFADKHISRATEAAYKKEFPYDLMEKVLKDGWCGTIIPEEYGGMGKEAGVTGCCIGMEGIARLGAIATSFATTMFGGCHQTVHFGNEEQKEKWLPKFARGEIMGAVCITEPFVGSDAAGVETVAVREGDEYILNGKKRFITNAGLADVYMVYAKTSDDPADRKSYKHLTGFLVEKGTPGFHVEKINELIGWDGVRNGYLRFDDARVPAENVLAGQGMGWNIMVNGLNFERTLGAIAGVSAIRECLRYAVFSTERRIQFGQPTKFYQANQLKMADMIANWKILRLLAYYIAYQIDIGGMAPLGPLLESTAAKIFITEAMRNAAIDTIQIMGGDALTRFYPIEAILRDCKILEIGAGTNEVLRLLLYRQGVRIHTNDFKAPWREMHKELRMPIPYMEVKPLPEGTEVDENVVLEVLAEYWRVNPGLHISRDQLLARLRIDEEKLDEMLMLLEEQELVSNYRDKKGVLALTRATYKGLKKAKPSEFYEYFPEWVDRSEFF
nr:acyl-CoA dehydrogenase family protein [Candidatus Freyarchaeota archaeon]